MILYVVISMNTTFKFLKKPCLPFRFITAHKQTDLEYFGYNARARDLSVVGDCICSCRNRYVTCTLLAVKMKTAA